MVRFIGLFKREWLEYRAAFIWAPASLLVVILLAGVSAVAINTAADVSWDAYDPAELAEKLGEDAQRQAGFLEIFAAMTLDVAGSTEAELKENMTTLLNRVAQPFHIVFVIVAFFVLLSCLYDERRDHSVLFWKSMPVSDLQTVASKLIFVVWLAPVVTIAAIVLAQLFVVFLSSIFVETGMSGRVWSASDVWLRPFGLIVRYVLLGFWALPLCGWLILVSSAATRLPVLWAIGIPWLAFLLEEIVSGTHGMADAVTGHFKVLSSSGAASVPGQFAMLSEASLWFGVIIGLLFLAGAVYLRGRNTEI